MEQEEAFAVYEGVEVPESALLKRERKNRYGSIDGLEDDELADPDELERQIYKEMFGPVLALPRELRRNWIEPVVEDGFVHFGAFSTVDFERTQPEFNKERYKAEKLREQLKDVLIMFEVVKERMSGKAKYMVLKYLRMGVIQLEHVVNQDMLALARLQLRAEGLQKEIRRLEEANWRRKEREREAWLASLA